MARRFAAPATLLILMLSAGSLSAWHDETHLAVAQAAGYRQWYNAMGADMAKVKAGLKEQNNHYFNNNKNRAVTAAVVWELVGKYNNPKNREGQLYGAIIASLRDYRTAKGAGKYAEYHLGYCAHYAGDLSQPLHNIPYDEFNKARHVEADGVVEHEALANVARIKGRMTQITLRPDRFDDDLAAAIAAVADEARLLGLRLSAENRNMTADEAYAQLGRSASLLQAILAVIAH